MIYLFLLIFVDVFAGFTVAKLTETLDPFSTAIIWYAWAFMLAGLMALYNRKDTLSFNKSDIGYPILGAIDALGWFFGIHLLGMSGRTAL